MQGKASLGPGLLAEEVCCIARDPLLQLGEFSFFFFVYDYWLTCECIAENLLEGVLFLCE